MPLFYRVNNFSGVKRALDENQPNIGTPARYRCRIRIGEWLKSR